MAMPAAQNAVLSSVAPTEIGKASGIFNTLRYFGGVFGVAILVATFATAGSFRSADAFVQGFMPAMAVAAILSLIGALAGARLPGRHPAASAPAGAKA
jgi:sugar phosphate permease